MALEDIAPTKVVTAAVGPAPGSPLLTLAPGMARVLWERNEARSRAEALASASRRLEAFLGIASHELRIPVLSSSLAVHVASVRVDRLRDDVAHPGRDAAVADQLAAVRDALATAESSLERLTRLVSDLLDASRLQSGQLVLHPAAADLCAIARAAVDEQRRLEPSRRIRLHLPARREAPVWADADRLHQVVTNYLTNALKYSAADLPVGVQVQVRAEWARVCVWDQGPGLAADEQARIWEPFHRVAEVKVAGVASRGSAQSLGLGLYICRTIIEQHHGQVGVRSAPGQGSIFWFALPLLPAIRSNREEPSGLARAAA